MSQNYIVQDYTKKWNGNKRYLLKILQAMPEENYDFKPIEGMKTFKSQTIHIYSWLNNHMKKIGLSGLTKVDTKSKESLLESITKIFDEIIEYITHIDSESLSTSMKMWYGESTHLRLLNLMDNHLSHHRGQMVVYLRLQGVKPPSYIGW